MDNVSPAGIRQIINENLWKLQEALHIEYRDILSLSSISHVTHIFVKVSGAVG